MPQGGSAAAKGAMSLSQNPSEETFGQALYAVSQSFRFRIPYSLLSHGPAAFPTQRAAIGDDAT